MWPSRPISRKYPSILPMPSRRTSPRYLAPAKSRRLELAPGSPRGAGLTLTNIRPLISLNSCSFTETTKWPHSSSQAVISAPEPPTVKTDSPSRPLKNRAERTVQKETFICLEETGSFDSGALPSTPSDTDSKLGVQGDSLQLARVKRVSPATSENYEAFPAAACTTYS